MLLVAAGYQSLQFLEKVNFILLGADSMNVVPPSRKQWSKNIKFILPLGSSLYHRKLSLKAMLLFF